MLVLVMEDVVGAGNVPLNAEECCPNKNSVTRARVDDTPEYDWYQ